ncbi:MAG: hypothetical protein AMJ90_04775 [candidate division Zixibacteria bacterium SM23_73_2]|nr:MAG: hypothetical protein AMJ90_04775 [candidate division Zixibacteria bacterium SM23_73_2]
MSVLLGLIFLAIVIIIAVLRKRKAVTQEVTSLSIWRKGEAFAVAKDKTPKREPSPFWKGIFVHPGHAWVHVLEPNLVAVGLDQFTRSVFGSIEELKPPEPGNLIEQGGKAWKFKRGDRQLVQTSPISGRVVEVNLDLVKDPKLFDQKDTTKNWIMKVKPVNLKKELQNLLHGNVLSRWNQAIKDQLISVLSPAEFPVLQEGGEIKPDLGDELTAQQWEKVVDEFF